MKSACWLFFFSSESIRLCFSNFSLRFASSFCLSATSCSQVATCLSYLSWLSLVPLKPSNKALESTTAMRGMASAPKAASGRMAARRRKDRMEYLLERLFDGEVGMHAGVRSGGPVVSFGWVQAPGKIEDQDAHHGNLEPEAKTPVALEIAQVDFFPWIRQAQRGAVDVSSQSLSVHVAGVHESNQVEELISHRIAQFHGCGEVGSAHSVKSDGCRIIATQLPLIAQEAAFAEKSVGLQDITSQDTALHFHVENEFAHGGEPPLGQGVPLVVVEIAAKNPTHLAVGQLDSRPTGGEHR